MMRLETERLIIRNWEDRDRELFHRINSDDDVMQFFPFRRSRAEAEDQIPHSSSSLVFLVFRGRTMAIRRGTRNAVPTGRIRR